MFAIIQTDGRQRRVSPGDVIHVDYRDESQPGDSVKFESVLLANGGAASVIGRPEIEGASVVAEVVEPLRKGPKLEVQKIRRRKNNSRRHTGHRQKYTLIKIGEITVPGLEVVESAVEEAAPAPVETPQVEETEQESAAETATEEESTASETAPTNEAAEAESEDAEKPAE